MIEDCTRVLRLDPDYTDAYRNRAVAYQKEGNSALAARDLERALQLEPNASWAPEARATLAAIRKRIGR